MKISKSKIILILVVALAAVLRLYKLGSVPPHLTPDEAALGYNAYSILKTGRDEHGALLPIIFESFGDYKPGLYVYTSIPTIFLLGLNEYSVRLPSAIFGVLSVLLMYLLSKELFKNEKLSILSAFFLAISPWHMFFSRGAWEINLSLMLTLAGIVCFLKSFVNKRYLLGASIFFALTLLSYQGAKLSSLIVLLLLIVFNFKKVLNFNKKILTTAVFLGGVVVLPVVISLFTGKASRLSVFSVFSFPRPESYIQNILDQSREHINSFSYYMFHSEWFNFVRGIMGRLFNHFSGRFLFFEGDFSNPRHSAPYAGMLLVTDLPILLIGLYISLKEKLTREYGFILVWLFLSPLPSILSRDQVHAVRSFNMVIPLTLVISIGAYYLFEILKKRKILLFILSVIYLFGFIYYLDAYFVHLPKLNSKYWEYGYKQIVETVTPLENKYTKIIVQQSYAQPYIYFLFFNKVDPSTYQAVARKTFVASSFGDVGQVSKLNNIYFEGIDWQVLRGKSGYLVVGDPVRLPEGDSKSGVEFQETKKIDYFDGNTAFRVIEIK